jgi:cupin superfamily acireductone dioxygenase involved in methionine salvage
MHKINIAEKFSNISEYWKPYIAAELNGQHVKLDKLKGEFVFHHHEHEDELFLVVKGRFRMEFRDRHEWIEEGEFIVIPRGVEHKPVAEEEYRQRRKRADPARTRTSISGWVVSVAA